MKIAVAVFCTAVASGSLVCPQVQAAEADAPPGIQEERTLPSRYPHVAQDILRLCRPQKGFWIDLGAGKGPVALALVQATGNPVVMVDPHADALREGLAQARAQNLQDRVLAVVGRAENLPFPDDSADLVVSRGSIFFWEDPPKGLQEVLRVLRPGGKAYIGGGAGSGYPRDAAERLVEIRKARLQEDTTGKWQRFVALRQPEQMVRWAQLAGLKKFEVLGKGALCADDPRVGQGVWLLFEKPAFAQPPSPPPAPATQRGVPNDERPVTHAGSCMCPCP